MPATFQEILNSGVVTFVVGEAADGVASEFKIHTSAISQLSKPLSLLTKENTEGRVVWKDVSKATFERFVQFAYTGDYSIPLPEDRTKPASVTASPVSSPQIPNGVPLRKRVGSEASSATAVELQENNRAASVLNESEQPSSTVLEKIEDDSGTILNYPTPLKKNKKKKSRAAVVAAIKAKEEAEKEEDNANIQTQADVDNTQHQQSDPVETIPPERTLPVPIPDSATAKLQSKVANENILNHSNSDPKPNPNPTSSTPIDAANPAPSSSSITPSSSTTTSFATLSYPLLAPLNNHASTCTPSPTFDASKSYSTILLSHAALYTLASTYLVRSLKVLSLWKLHQTLCVFELGGEREDGGQSGQSVGDITDLARYAYANDGVGKSAAATISINGTKNGVGSELGKIHEGGIPAAGGREGVGEGEGEMRALVCAYLAGHAVVLGRDAGFMDLLAEGGQIVKDFFRFQLQSRG